MKYEIIEITNGKEKVFYKGVTDKFKTLAWFEKLVNDRNEKWGSKSTSYYLRAA